MNPHEHEHSSDAGVELPTPTTWPLMCAFGITLLAVGLVTTLIVTLIGFIIGLIAAVGWFRSVFPTPKHTLYALAEADRRPAPVRVSPRRIDHLQYGESSHRTRIPVEVHRYSSGILGGLAGGAAMAVLAVAYGLIVQHSIWYPINLLAASGVPSLATASLETLREFNAAGLTVAILSHLAFSILVGLLYTVLLPMLPARLEWLFGGVMTPLIWTALIYPTFNLINPALAARVDWLWFLICQVSFGVVGGYVVFKSQKVETMQSWSLGQRMGLHAMPQKEKEE
ncbi:MAG: hypothetical protein JO066_08360 [Verrucomicrobia bacterium]|nr:hypothetical protein [Verrucomicrobiota bacterium]